LVAFVPPALRSAVSAGVSVGNPAPGGGTTDRVPVGFLAPAPLIITMTPNTAHQSSQFSAVISGQNFINPVSVKFSSSDVTATIQPGSDVSTLNIVVTVGPAAPLGLRSLIVETGSRSATLPSALQIQRSSPPSTAPLPIPDVETGDVRSEEHTSELQSRGHLVCRLLLEKKNQQRRDDPNPRKPNE